MAKGFMVDLRWRLARCDYHREEFRRPPAAMLNEYDPAYLGQAFVRCSIEVDKESNEQTFHKPGIANIYSRKKPEL
jgi:hypothetical protein